MSDKLLITFLIVSAISILLVFVGALRFKVKDAGSDAGTDSASSGTDHSGNNPDSDKGEKTPPPRAVKVVITTGEKRLSDEMPLTLHSTSEGSTLPTIRIDPEKTYQKWVGIGAAITHSAALNLEKLPEDSLQSILLDFFKDKKFNLCRLCIGASDYADHVFSLCDGEPADEVLAHFTNEFNKKYGTHYAILQKADPNLTRFNINYDQKHVTPILRKMLAINPQLRFFASPWSPPGWMKGNNSMLGGCMQRRYMSSYARYFVKFIRAYEAEGVPIWAVTIQNEVDTDQDGRMPACVWPAEYEADFIAWFIGPEFQKEGLTTKIWAIDHNPNNWGRAMSFAEDPNVARYLDAFAWHDYRGGRDKYSVVHDAFPQIDAYWTEGGPDYDKPDYGTNWTQWGKVITGAARNWCKGWTAWNLALDENGLPKIGPFNCGGMITINSLSKQVAYSGQYWAAAQFSKYVERDAVRVESSGEIADIDHVAFVNPDGKTVLVVTNSGAARMVAIEVGGQHTQVQLPADSITTLCW